MKSKKFVNMSREEVVASMANKLAEGGNQNIFKSKPKVPYRKIIPVAGGVLLLLFIVLWILTANRENIEPVTANVISSESILANRNPLYKLKNAYNGNSISADHYALYLKDILTRYDSLPEEYKIPRPVINQSDIYTELADIWVKVNPAVRLQITKNLPQFTLKQQDRYDGTK